MEDTIDHVLMSHYYWTVDNANQPRFAGKSYHLA